MEPLVSIITVCYNSQNTIERTVLSVLNQSYSNIEYIIIDGMSTDETVPIVKKYAGQNSKIIWLSEHDLGIYDAMNKGIKMSHGEIIGLINSDDWYDLDAVEIVVNKYIEEKKRAAVYYGIMGLYQNSIEKSWLFYSHNFLPETMLNHPACFVARQIYEKYGVYDFTYKAAADYDFMLRLFFEDADSLFVPIHTKLANFSIGGVSGTDISIEETEEIQCKYGIMSSKMKNRRKIVRRIKKILHYF